MAAAQDLMTGYRRSLVLGAASCLFALLANLVATIYAGTRPDLDQDGRGRRVLYTGSCDVAKNLNTGLHVLINILGSLLLAASNYGIQCLSAPTREQVDGAHAKGTYLDIGIISLRNLGHQTNLTRLLWYNSVVFPSMTVPSVYPVVIIDERARHVPDRLLALMAQDDWPYVIRETHEWALEPRDSAIALVEDYKNGRAFDNLTASECIDQYSVTFLTSRRGLFVVHERHDDAEFMGGEDFLLDWRLAQHGSAHSPSGFDEHFSWICASFSPELDQQCRLSLDGIREDAAHWNPFFDAPIRYCLSQPVEDQLCRVNFNVFMAVGIIAANLVKLAILGYVALYLAPDRLLVLGDAIQSFLARPDPHTMQSCLASVRLVRDSLRSSGRADWRGPRSLSAPNKRWITPVGKMRCATGIILYIIAFFTVVALLIWGIGFLKMPITWPNLWSIGFGRPHEETIISWPGSRGNHPSIIANVIIANMPHLIFSLIYFQWNAILTSMLMGREWNDLSTHRVALRVSDQPRQEQRSRHFLQLPFRFSVPLIAASILLHWILSQSIFIVAAESRRVVGSRTDEDVVESIFWGLISCGYSPLAIMTLLLVSLVMPISVIVLGLRRLPGPMPVAGSCSLAIAAACHHPDGAEHPEAALDTLQWGVMMDEKRQHHQQEDHGEGERGQEESGSFHTTQSNQHCGFSDAIVEDPQEGVVYS